MTTTILRLPQVMQRTGFSRSAIYKLVAAGSFPRPISLSIRAVGWLEQDVEEWLSARIAASRSVRVSRRRSSRS